jgi:hypothetical protein
VARIRSIKPDFFQSEKIAALPLSARILFVGMWTHADDNGVMVDNEKLINAAVWPLEDDPLETLRRTREDLRRLSSVHLIARYVTENRNLIFIAGWDEHQRVSHPGKERYPRPTAEQIKAATCGNGDAPQSLARVSGGSREDLVKPPETLVPEQGAGSREQGREKTSSPASRARARAPKPDYSDDPDWLKFWSVYPRKVSKKEALEAWPAAIKRATPGEIIAGAERYADEVQRSRTPAAKVKYPQGWLNGDRWLDEATPAGPAGYQPYRNPTDQSIYDEDI